MLLLSHQEARILRNRMTDTERFLWRKLRQQFLDCTFRRQAPNRSYIVDFVCFERKLVWRSMAVNTWTAKAYDSRSLVEGEGFRVLRFWNHEVSEDVTGFLNHCNRGPFACRGSMPSP